jgi:hypothetical protein
VSQDGKEALLFCEQKKAKKLYLLRDLAMSLPALAGA